jgi:hypothetical protein
MFWSITIDVLLVLVFLFFIIFWAKSGIVARLTDFSKKWLELLCSILLGPFLAGLLANLFLSEWINTGVFNSIQAVVENNANGYTLVELFEHLPEAVQSFFLHMGVDMEVLISKYGATAEVDSAIIADMSGTVSAVIVSVVSTIVGMIVCYWVPKLGFMLAQKLIKDRNAQGKFGRTMDHVLGGVVGVVVSYLIVSLLAIGLFLAFQVVLAVDLNAGTMDVYNATYVFKFLREFDLVAALKDLVGNAYKLLLAIPI